MRDEADARLWNAHHGDFSQGLAHGLDRVMVAFRKLTAIQYAAPWDAPRRCPN